jgi:hypothetical protein
MIEYEWFLSVLDKEDLLRICNKYKIQPEGFAKRLENAPKTRLGNELKSCLYAALERKKKRKTLKFEILLKWIVDEVIASHPFIKNLSFDTFVIEMETDTSIKNYQIIALLKVLFNEEYNNFLDKMIENTNNKEYILSGLSSISNRSTSEKIRSVIGNHMNSDDIKKRFTEYEKDFLGEFSNEYFKTKEMINGDEELLLNFLIKANKSIQPYLMLAFLLTHDNYKNTNYTELLNKVESVFERKRFESQQKRCEELNGQLSGLTNIENRLKKTKQNLTDIKNECSNLQETLELSSKEIEKLKAANQVLRKEIKVREEKVRNNEPIINYFSQFIQSKDMLIITSDSEMFKGTPFESNVIDRVRFMDDKKKKNTDSYIGKTLFFTRSSFQTREWGRLKTFLEASSLKYIEIGYFDLSSYIGDIMKHLYREENDYDYEYI